MIFEECKVLEKGSRIRESSSCVSRRIKSNEVFIILYLLNETLCLQILESWDIFDGTWSYLFTVDIFLSDILQSPSIRYFSLGHYLTDFCQRFSDGELSDRVIAQIRKGDFFGRIPWEYHKALYFSCLEKVARNLLEQNHRKCEKVVLSKMRLLKKNF